MEISERQTLGPPAVSPGPEASPIAFLSTAGFEADMGRLSLPERVRIGDEINHRCRLIVGHRESFEADLSRPFEPKLGDGLDSTLSVKSLPGDHRVILTVDDDPLFGEIRVTLLRVVPPAEVESAFRATAALLYDGL